MEYETEHFVISLSYAPPRPPPDSGDSWEEELDFPGIQLVARTIGDYLAAEARGPVPFFGEELTIDWGRDCGNARERHRCHRCLAKTFYASTLEAAEAAARAYVEEELLRLEVQVLGPRRVRLAQRAATIAAAHAVHGEIIP